MPVSVRRWLSGGVEGEFGVFVDACGHVFSRLEGRGEGGLKEMEEMEGDEKAGEEGVWEDAKRARETIGEYLASGGDRISIGAFKHVEDMRTIFAGTEGQERRCTFDVSNLGVIRSDAADSGSA